MAETPKVDPPRAHVTVEYNGDAPLALPAALMDGKRVRVTLKPGKTQIARAYWHAVGGDPEVNDLIADGTLKTVCEEHVFYRADGTPYQPLIVNGATVGHACRYCGVQEEPPVEEMRVVHTPPVDTVDETLLPPPLSLPDLPEPSKPHAT